MYITGGYTLIWIQVDMGSSVLMLGHVDLKCRRSGGEVWRLMFAFAFRIKTLLVHNSCIFTHGADCRHREGLTRLYPFVSASGVASQHSPPRFKNVYLRGTGSAFPSADMRAALLLADRDRRRRAALLLAELSGLERAALLLADLHSF